MASTSGRKTSSGKKRTASGKKGNTRKKNSKTAYRPEQDYELFREIGLIVLFVVMVILFLCNFGIIGPVGNAVSGVLFGLFGWTAYLFPVAVFMGAAFWMANQGSPTAVRKIVAGGVLFIMTGIVCELLAGNAAEMEGYDIRLLYELCRDNHNGGGAAAGSLAYLSLKYLETIGTILLVLLCSIICVILITEKLLLNAVRERGAEWRERSREDQELRREAAIKRRGDMEALRQEKEERRRQEQEEKISRRQEQLLRSSKEQEERRKKAEEKETERILRRDRRAVGVTMDTSLEKSSDRKKRDDIREITLDSLENTAESEGAAADALLSEPQPEPDFDRIHIRSANTKSINEYPAEQEPQSDLRNTEEPIYEPEVIEDRQTYEPSGKQEEVLLTKEAEAIQVHSEATEPKRPAVRPAAGGNDGSADAQIHKDMQKTEKSMPKKYIFPPFSRLKKGAAAVGDSSRELKETAMRLQQTLATFGVKVTITDISQGPSVTRYELQPEQGVKVSRIVSLADDIKLNLAATDIRIEAPIPGKAAIGIEVPNKENTMVALRDLLESTEFKEFPSNLAFAVGKDIAGKIVVADIAKMPHMLIAGATGSGKSVCINTLIMSILYKAHPDDVKLILIDPKVVELSVYNGIPHLLIPVVTDPKKASAALHWGVSEMTDRYQKFADMNVRDLKGYNQKAESMREAGQEDAPAKLPQIVIIVDELADLMMVAPGEVEESICRLAQLARAAGIHLVIATQRPSVDVITGLIKANMPSRVAFAVSSGVDSRTILDMVGAEKLLGKGDMLFYPQGYSKPARIQGAFVSDKEVSDVVDFLKNQTIGNVYASDIEDKIKSLDGGAGGAGGGSERDEYFAEAGRFIIEKDKASIGMLQRVLKIGFNRAARIMDQLAEYGVVGEEEGTKPRKVLMTEEQFEQLLEEI